MTLPARALPLTFVGAAAAPKGEVPLQQDPGSIIRLTQQGGLARKLEPCKGPIEVMVVDHVEKPREN